MISTATPTLARYIPTLAAPAARPRRASSDHMLKTVGASIGAGVVATSIGSFTATVGSLASLPLAEAVVAGYPGFQGLAAILHFAILSQAAGAVAIAGAAGVGLVAGALAMKAAPAAPGAIRRFFEKPASALRDGAAEISNAASMKDGARAGAHAGWKAGQTIGAVAGGLQGLGTGYSLGLLATGLVTATPALFIAGGVVGAAVGAAALCMAGKYVGGAVGAGFGALAGAAGSA